MKTRMTSFTLEPTLLRKKSNLDGDPDAPRPGEEHRHGEDTLQRVGGEAGGGRAQ